MSTSLTAADSMEFVTVFITGKGLYIDIKIVIANTHTGIM